MFTRFDKVTVWYKDKGPYSRYIKGKLEDLEFQGLVFKSENGGFEIWNPTLNCLYLSKK